MPKQAGEPTVTGRIHVFSVADNGTALTFTPSADQNVKVGTATTLELGSVSGGVGGKDGYRARVQWGDGTLTEDATLGAANASGRVAITGTHTWATQGSHRVTVLATDAATGESVGQFGVTVGATRSTVRDRTAASAQLGAPALRLGASSRALRPGSVITVQGNGFRPGEKVTLGLGNGPSGRAAQALTADPAGRVTGRVSVPTGTPDGSYAVWLAGVSSKARVAQPVTVAPAALAPHWNPRLVLGATSGPAGTLVRWDTNSFAADEWVSVSVDGKQVGNVRANADGALTQQQLIVPAGLKGGAHTVTLTGGSSAASATATFTVTG